MLDDESNDTTTTTGSASGDPGGPAGGSPATESAGETPPPPVKATRRRRATKATAAPAPADAAAAASPDAAAPGGAAAPGDPSGTAGSVAPDPAPAEPPVAEGGVSAAGETAGYAQDPAPEGAAEPAAPAAPAKRVRKAPAKKAAPRKRATKAVAAPAPEPTAAEELEAAAAVLPEAEADLARRLEEPQSAVLTGVEEDPVVAQSASEDVVPEGLLAAERAEVAQDADVPTAQVTDQAPASDAVAAEVASPPTPRTRRRRAPAIVTFQAPEVHAPDVPVDDATDEVTDDAAEQAPAPRRRRRAGTTGALPPSALVPTLLAPEPAPEPDDAVEELDDQDLPPEETDDADRPRRRRRGRRGRGRRDEVEAGEGDDSDAAEPVAGAPSDDEPQAQDETDETDDDEEAADGTRRRRRRRRRGGGGDASADEPGDDVPTVVHVREPRQARVRGASAADEDGVRGITGSTRMAAKRARRQEGRDSGRRRQPVLTEAEFLARREAVERVMVVRQQGERTQIAVLEDGILVEHYVTKASAQAFAGNVYLGKVQNVLPSMEAAFVDIGKGKNGVLYAGEVNYDGQSGGQRKIEQVLKSGQDVLVQVSKDPIGHKGARLTSQVSLPGRYLVYVPEGSMTGISRKLPDTERSRLKGILKKIVPEDAGVIIRTAAEGASEEELTADVRRLQAQWEVIRTRAAEGGGPVLLHAEPDLVIRVVRDIFNEDFARLVVQGESEWETIRDYVEFVAPELAPRLSRHDAAVDVFAAHRIDEQLAKALDRKVWLPSGGSLVIDRTEAMVVIDVNTGKYVGKGGNLEETVTRNNLEAAEEIARQLRLRDLGGIIVVDFIDMVLESNRDLVVRRLVECLGRDRTKHQIAEVTSLGLVQMTRKRVGQGLLESFSETCEACGGRGVIVHPSMAETGLEERAPRERPKAAAAAAAARVAAATLRPADPVADAPAAAGAGAAEAEDDSAPRRRRRRGGRGAGAAGERAAQEAVEPVDQEPVEQEPAEPADASSVDGPGVTGLDGPDLVPELGDQPTPAEEDLPVVPDVGSVLDPDLDEPVQAGEPATAQLDDVEAVDAAPVDLEQQPEPEQAPEPVQVEDGADEAGVVEVPDVPAQPVVPVLAGALAGGAGSPDDAPAAAPSAPPARPRRRRATSRPAGPPTTD